MLTKLTDIDTIARSMRKQYIGLLPSDTLWGISGIACADVAKRIQLIKNRHTPKPLILLIHSLAQLTDWIVPLSETQPQLCNSHWPGPVTLLLPASTMAPHALTAGLPTLGVRMPATPHLKDLLIALDRPLISTSANLTGHPAPAQRQDIHPDILSLVAFQANWEDPPGNASLIFDLTQDPPVRVR